MENRGIGIGAWNSGFYVVSSLTEGAHNHFNYLNYGIKTYAFSGHNKTIKIDSAIFTRNQTGCYLGAETFASVIRNIFEAERKDELLPNGYCGLYLDACTGYQVEENVFYSSYIPSSFQSFAKCYGIVVNNSGSDDNMIYNNQFHNISWAVQAQGQNRSKGGETGLTIKCNDFQNNYQDIIVTADETGDIYGIKESQGSEANVITAPAGNTFSHIDSPNNLYSDYFNNCKQIIYCHHVQDINNPAVWVYPALHNEPEVQPKNNKPNGPHFIKEDACPTNLDPKTYTETKSDIAAAESNRTIYADSLNNLTDDGNTVSLNLDVVTSMPPETIQLRDQLLGASPYLSDTVW
jgi:hypothetical protein